MTKFLDVIYVSEYDTLLNFDSEDDANTIAGRGHNEKYIRADLADTRIRQLEAALRNMIALYDTDEGCRSLPAYKEARDVLDAGR